MHFQIIFKEIKKIIFNQIIHLNYLLIKIYVFSQYNILYLFQTEYEKLDNLNENNSILLFLYDSRIQEVQLTYFLNNNKNIISSNKDHVSFLIGNIFLPQKQITTEILEQKAKEYKIYNSYEININNLLSIEALFNLIIVETFNTFQCIIECPFIFDSNSENENKIDNKTSEEKKINSELINPFGDFEITTERDEILRQLLNKINFKEKMNLGFYEMIRQLKEELLRKESMKAQQKERNMSIKENTKKCDEQIKKVELDMSQLDEKYEKIKKNAIKYDIDKIKSEVEIAKKNSENCKNKFNDEDKKIILKERELEPIKNELEQLINERDKVKNNLKKLNKKLNELKKRKVVLEEIIKKKK